MTAHEPGCGCLLCPDPHEDYYFALLPPDWKRMPLEERLAMIETLDPATRAECRRRMQMRKLVSRGRWLAQQAADRGEERSRRLWHGFAVDAALYRIAMRVAAHREPDTVSG